MRPHFFSRMPASAGCTEKNAPVRLMSSVLVHSSGSNLFGRRAFRGAGIGDHDGEGAARLLRRPVKLADRRDVGHVGRLGVNIGMPLRREFQFFGAAPANRDLRAGLRQRKRDRGADAAAAAGHKCVLACKDRHRHTAGVCGFTAAGQPIKLIAAGVIGFRPCLAAVAEPGGGVQGPVRVGKMRPGEADEVGAAGHQNRVHVVGLVDVADRHRRHAGLVADAIGERGLEHAAIDRLSPDRGLAGGHVADIDPGLLQHAADLDRVARFDAFVADPVIRGNAYRDRLFAPATPRARRERSPADSACDFRASRHTGRCAGWSAA